MEDERAEATLCIALHCIALHCIALHCLGMARVVYSNSSDVNLPTVLVRFWQLVHN